MTGGGDHGAVHSHRARAQMKLADLKGRGVTQSFKASAGDQMPSATSSGPFNPQIGWQSDIAQVASAAETLNQMHLKWLPLSSECLGKTKSCYKIFMPTIWHWGRGKFAF
jgi:hypothetical protein